MLNKGYLKIGEIKYSQTVLTRAYRPCLPLVEFLKDEYGEVVVEWLVNHKIDSLENTQQLKILLDPIAEIKSIIKRNN